MSRLERLTWILVAAIALAGSFHGMLFVLKSQATASNIQGQMLGYQRGVAETIQKCAKPSPRYERRT
jgi:hypothetical protein